MLSASADDAPGGPVGSGRRSTPSCLLDTRCDWATCRTGHFGSVKKEFKQGPTRSFNGRAWTKSRHWMRESHFKLRHERSAGDEPFKMDLRASPA
jgi:hypothetical protein